jgi:amidase
VSIGPDINEVSQFLVVDLCVSRSVRDTAGVLDALVGTFPGDPAPAAPPARPYRDEVGADPGKLRIALQTTNPIGATAVHPDCAAAAEATARLLESLGHTVEVAAPPGFDDEELIMQFSAVWAADCAYFLGDWGRKVGRDVTADDVEILTWALAEMGRSVTAAELVTATSDAMKANREAATFWSHGEGGQGYDLLLTPTLGEPPVPHGTFDSTPEDPLGGFMRAAAFVPFTAQFNVSGQPGINLPLSWNDDGLPVGSQLVAGFGREDLLLRVAAQLEAAQPWADRLPAVHA